MSDDRCFFFFFFSSRRRHTRLQGDWSSDVCSSDLRFQFFLRTALDKLKLPETDRESIWPWFWQHRGGFFAAHCHCHSDGRNEWTLEESAILGPRSTAHSISLTQDSGLRTQD